MDLLRTLALVSMILYHAIYDLDVFWKFDIDPFSPGWIFFARSTAVLFLLLVGVSAHLSAFRRNFALRWNVRRLASIALGAVSVSLATFIMNPETFVRFGILHLIAFSALILPLTLPLRRWNICLGIAVIALTPLLPTIHITTVDWFPPFPWLGVILIGTGIGAFFYSTPLSPRGRGATQWRGGGILTWPSRHSLLVYLLHQPMLFLVLSILLGKPNL